jgi:UDP-N-acetylenolpyruvoylglucosamine reductase
LGDAKAEDVLQLIQMAKDKIKEAEHIELETEIRVVGDHE